MSKYGSANAEQKVARVPVKFAPTERSERLKKPAWIRARFPGTPEVTRLKKTLRGHGLNTVCEEASCPNLGECFANGTATFMILGDVCTRRCPFCDVAHGRPQPVDTGEAIRLADTVREMGLHYVVVTSVDRDDLRDGGAQHFADCIGALGSLVLNWKSKSSRRTFEHVSKKPWISWGRSYRTYSITTLKQCRAYKQQR